MTATIQSTPSPPPGQSIDSPDTLYITDGWGYLHPIPRPLAENATHTGQPVLIALTAQACREALTGPRQLTDTEQAIVDVLRRVGAPMTSQELADIDAVGVTVEHVKRLLQPGGHLRSAGLVKHQKGAGYYIPNSSPKLSPLDSIIAEIVRDQPGITRVEIERMAEKQYGHTIGTDGVANRMRRGLPLRRLGFHVRGREYYPPASGAGAGE